MAINLKNKKFLPVSKVKKYPLFDNKSQFDESPYKDSIIFFMDKTSLYGNAKDLFSKSAYQYQMLRKMDKYLGEFLKDDLKLYAGYFEDKKGYKIFQGYILLNSTLGKYYLQSIQKNYLKNDIKLIVKEISSTTISAKLFYQTLPASVSGETKMANVTDIYSQIDTIFKTYNVETPTKPSTTTEETTTNTKKETVPENKTKEKEETDTKKPIELHKDGQLTSIRKAVTYKAPITRIKLTFSDIPSDLHTILSYLVKNTPYEFSLENYQRARLGSTFYDGEHSRLIENPITVQELNYFLPVETLDDFYFVLDTSQHSKTNDSTLVCIHKNSKIPKKHAGKSYYADSVQHVSRTKKYKTEYNTVSLRNFNDIFSKSTIIENMKDANVFDEFHLEVFSTLLGIFKGNTKPKFIKKISQLINGKDLNKIGDVKASTIQVVYDNLLNYYSELLQKDEVSTQKSTYATSYMDKKHINKSTLDAMEKSLFISDSIKYVEIDNDVDLDKYRALEEQFLEIKPLLPKLNKPIDVRFRKLGKLGGKGYKVLGVYYSGAKSMAMDLDSTNSFVHEFGHAIDYDYATVGDSLSLEPEFNSIRTLYTKFYTANAKKADKVVTQKDYEYYLKPTEIFARAFETYMWENNVKKSLILEQDELSYTPFKKEKLLHEVLEYFDKILNY